MDFQVREIHEQPLQRDQRLVGARSLAGLWKNGVAERGRHALPEILVLAVLLHLRFHLLAHPLRHRAERLDARVDLHVVHELRQQPVADLDQHVDRLVRGAHVVFEVALARRVVGDGGRVRFLLLDFVDGGRLLLFGVDHDVAGVVFAFLDSDGAGFEHGLFGDWIPLLWRGKISCCGRWGSYI